VIAGWAAGHPVRKVDLTLFSQAGQGSGQGEAVSTRKDGDRSSPVVRLLLLRGQVRTIWDQCYDFLNIFEKNRAKYSKEFIITLVFEKNANFSPKIVENRRKL
jgi:hypothetical protein